LLLPGNALKRPFQADIKAFDASLKFRRFIYRKMYISLVWSKQTGILTYDCIRRRTNLLNYRLFSVESQCLQAHELAGIKVSGTIDPFKYLGKVAAGNNKHAATGVRRIRP